MKTLSSYLPRMGKLHLQRNNTEPSRVSSAVELAVANSNIYLENANNSISLREESSFLETNRSKPAQEERERIEKSPQAENFAKPNARSHKRKRNEGDNEAEMLQSAFKIFADQSEFDHNPAHRMYPYPPSPSTSNAIRVTVPISILSPSNTEHTNYSAPTPSSASTDQSQEINDYICL
ncbi:hypothetical protein KPH14_001057 [Odynerus spinipes]|uniref:Uncharacterized protein n=1 Tax=Odynerus spinipes TaxID=1348599 RepID=A0AAD9REP2_9HYME|nr:hypothetical protein KPH14_001057 [Odynerus spinipes]